MKPLSKRQLPSLLKGRTFVLADFIRHDTTAMEVTVYVDKQNGIVFQVDEVANKYRWTPTTGTLQYGDFAELQP